MFENQSGLISTRDIQDKSILVVGAGAIGGFTTMALAKMGATKITVFDADKIEPHNIPNQIYPYSSLNRSKVGSLYKLAQDFSGGTKIKSLEAKWHPNRKNSSEIVIAAVDDMDTRKMIWDSVKDTCKLFIDPRMGGLVYRVYAIEPRNKKQVKFYESNLYPSSKAVKERCGQKSIIFTVLGVSSTILDLVKKYVNNEKRPLEVVYDFKNNIQVVNYGD